jgi:hypothetical protein
MTGFEPAPSRATTWRSNQAELHPPQAGAPEGIRTPDPQLRRLPLYPSELARLVAWRHPGFSAHLGDRIAAEDKQRLEDTAAYLVRNPLSLKKLVYLDGQKGRALLLEAESLPGAKLREPTSAETKRDS